MIQNGGGNTTHNDRTLGLLLFGVIEILIGAGTAILMPVVLLFSATMGVSVDPRSFIPVALLYEIGAFAFIALGIGSIRARRWAREIWLSISWIWLLTGLCSVVVSWFLLPIVLSDTVGTAGLDGRVVFVLTSITLAVLVSLYVVLPGAMLLFYRSPHVAATCRARNPRPQWTDHLSQRLLTLTLLWVILGLSVVVMHAYSWVFPVFGWIWTGWAGAVAWSASAAWLAALAWGTSQKRLWSWRTAMVLTSTAAVSTILTFARLDMNTIVRAMDVPADQAVMVASIAGINRLTMVIFWSVTWGSFLIYLRSLRREFEWPENRDG